MAEDHVRFYFCLALITNLRLQWTQAKKKRENNLSQLKSVNIIACSQINLDFCQDKTDGRTKQKKME